MNANENLFNAANLMRKCGDEIDVMMEKIKQMLLEDLCQVEEIHRVELGREDVSGNDWVTDGVIHELNLYEKRKKKPSAHLAIQISLADRKEEAILGQKIPLLYVLFSKYGFWDYNEFQLDSAINNGYTLKEDCLWFWSEAQDTNYDFSCSNFCWAYTLPLISLNSKEDLRDNISMPVIEILQGKTLDSVFSANNKVLTFTLENQKLNVEE